MMTDIPAYLESKSHEMEMFCPSASTPDSTADDDDADEYPFVVWNGCDCMRYNAIECTFDQFIRGNNESVTHSQALVDLKSGKLRVVQFVRRCEDEFLANHGHVPMCARTRLNEHYCNLYKEEEARNASCCVKNKKVVVAKKKMMVAAKYKRNL